MKPKVSNKKQVKQKEKKRVRDSDDDIKIIGDNKNTLVSQMISTPS